MARLDEIEAALRAADAAGNVEDARTLAAAYASEKSAAAPASAPAAPVAAGDTRSGLQQGVDFLKGGMRRALPGFSMLHDTFSTGDPAQDVKNAAGGAIRGAGSIGATAVRPFESADENAQRRKDIDAGLQSAIGADPSSRLYGATKLGGEMAGTAGVGSALALPLKAAGVAPALATALESGGMATGLNPSSMIGRVGDMALRSGAGAAVGGTSAGMVDPGSAKTGAAVGGILPPALKLVGGAGDLAARGARSLLAGDAPRDASTILRAGQYGAGDVPALRSALQDTGPRIVNAPRTVPQILQNPGISQFGRTLNNAGDKSLLTAQQLQDAARMDALNRVAPVQTSTVEAANNFGNQFRPAIQAKDAAAKAATSKAFGAVDPFGETRFALPIDELQAARDRYLRPSIFGKGGAAGEAVDTARAIGTEQLPAVTAAKVPVRQGEDLFSAMKSLGGIKQDSTGAKAFAGELQALKQSGARAVIKNGSGQSPDTLAQAMHARGFIADDDPATLFAAMREHAMGNKVFSVGSDRKGAMRAGVEAAMGDAPGAASIPKPVEFAELQDFRSWLGEKGREATQAGKNREASALTSMRSKIDQSVENAAAGNGRPGDNFPPDIVDQWRKARAMHKARIDTFRGDPANPNPVGNVFRGNVDDGALASKFYSPRASQTNDVQSFRAAADPESVDLLKSYATTGAAGTAKKGRLTDSAYNNFMRQRAGANEALFSDAERATLGGIGTDLRQADAAATLGMGPGSNTAQNLLGLGMLDSPVVSAVANRVPGVRYVAGPLLAGVRSSLTRGKVDRLGQLMADPVALEQALAAYQRLNRAPQYLLGMRDLSPLVRAAPVLTTGQ